jgi:hypothetical protein
MGKIRRRRNLIKEQAQKFFETCETGNGWEGCKDYCQPQATFSAQADALGGVDTLEGYTDWMKGLLGFFFLECLGLLAPMERLMPGCFGLTLGRCTRLENSSGLVGGVGPLMSRSSGNLFVLSFGI